MTRAQLRAAAARVSDGTHQSERFPAALHADHFLPDEMAMHDRVAVAERMARELAFIGPDNRPAGTWSAMFQADEALLLMQLISRAGRDAAVAALDADAATPEQLADAVRRLVDDMQHWQGLLRRNDGDAARVVVRLLDDLRAHRLDAELALLPQRLQVARAALDGAADAAQPTAGRRARAARDGLRQTLAMMASALDRLREVAREQLVLSMRSGHHDPAAALFTAFMQVFGAVQSRINRFTDRHTDFYHLEVLRMKPLPATPDSLHLVAVRDAGAAGDLLLPRGTAFMAGKDAAGRDIVLRSDDDVVLTDAQVAALCTLRLGRDPLISPEHDMGYVSRARVQHLPARPPAAALAGAALPHWPLLGGTEQGASGDADVACIGLAVASPLLLLSDGEREITLGLRLGHGAIGEKRLQGLVHKHLEDGGRDDDLLATLVQAYIDLERQQPAAGACTAAELAKGQSAIAAAGADQADPMVDALAYYRWFLMRRATADYRRSQEARGQDEADGERDDAPAAGPRAIRRPVDEAARRSLGRLFTHWLLSPPAASGDDWLDALPQDVRQALLEPFDGAASDRTALFNRLFAGLFAVSLTTAQGWYDVVDSFVVRPAGVDRAGISVLQVVVRLAAGGPAVTGCDPALHGAEWDTPWPVARLKLQPYGGLFAYSMLETSLLREVTVGVAVAGLRDVVLHNQLGRLDASKPFQPFGPLPVAGSYLVVGSRELSRKPLTGLTLNLRWGGLPNDPGGFATHYAAYPGDIDNRSFRVALAILRDGDWVTPAGGARTRSLFAAREAAHPLSPHAEIAFDDDALRQHFRPHGEAWPDGLPGYGMGTRSGFVRLQLVQPEGAFGHAEYPTLLTDVVTRNVRRRRPAPLPRPPYTPVLEGMSLDYRAHGVIRLDDEGAGRAGADARAPGKLYHLHPFGTRCLHPVPSHGDCRLLPRYGHDGNLYIGLRASRGQGRLSLLFQMNEEAAVARDGPMPATRWWTLRGDEWQPLPADHVLSDSTSGFLTTGIIVLQLPEDLDDRHQVMPTGLHWLAVGADDGFERFAGLHGVRAQALQVTRVLDGETVPHLLAPGTAVAPAVAVPGLAAVEAVGGSFGLRAAESARELRIRTGERLRHKQRASLPWDVERLVLEHFPQVCKAKCFTAADLPGAEPGLVLVAVVPSPQQFDRAAGVLYPRLHAVELLRMTEMLQARASPHARIAVRNASYERVQVRCAVRLQRGVAAGEALQRVERAVFDFLSPWVAGGLQPRFGWVVRQEDVEARLRALPEVDFVTGLSMLHVARDDDGYHWLGDTAATDEAAAPAAASAPPATPVAASSAGVVQRVEVRPSVPWSIAVPMDRQMISVSRHSDGEPPRHSGIRDLSVGRNFIIGRARHG